MKLMTVATRSMTGPGVTGVDPQGQAVGRARTGRVAGDRLFFAANLRLHPETEFIPGQAYVGEVARFVEAGEVVDPTTLGKIEKLVALFQRHLLEVTTGMGDTKEKTRGNERHPDLLS